MKCPQCGRECKLIVFYGGYSEFRMWRCSNIDYHGRAVYFDSTTGAHVLDAVRRGQAVRRG